MIVAYDKLLLQRPPHLKADGSGYDWREFDRFLQKLYEMLGLFLAPKAYNVPEEIKDLQAQVLLASPLKDYDAIIKEIESKLALLDLPKDCHAIIEEIKARLLFESTPPDWSRNISDLMTQEAFAISDNPTWENRIRALEAKVFTWNYSTAGSVNAAAYNGYLCAGVTALTLPSSPKVGDIIGIVDAAGVFNVLATNLTVARNGSPIMGLAADLLVDVQYAAFYLIYSDGTNGWRVIL